MNEHVHAWQTMPNANKLICHRCNTVSDIETLLKRERAIAAREMKVKLLSDQLYARELKKDAHDAAYAWVRVNSPEAILERKKQEQAVLV